MKDDPRVANGSATPDTYWSIVPPWIMGTSSRAWKWLDLPRDNSKHPHRYVYTRVIEKGEPIKVGIVEANGIRVGHGGIHTEIQNVEAKPAQFWGILDE